MKKKLVAAIAVTLLALAAITPAVAKQPPGQLGYEGQPGNQGGGQHAGQHGYEGQPGNQGGSQHNP
jgi:opacity protein-like surface antigen